MLVALLYRLLLAVIVLQEAWWDDLKDIIVLISPETMHRCGTSCQRKLTVKLADSGLPGKWLLNQCV